MVDDVCWGTALSDEENEELMDDVCWGTTLSYEGQENEGQENRDEESMMRTTTREKAVSNINYKIIQLIYTETN